MVTLFCLQSQVLAEEWATTNGVWWYYKVSGGKATICHTWPQDGSPDPMKGEAILRIPSSLDGHPVTGIGDGAFSHCTGLKRVSIPKSVTSIGEGAFAGCSGLTGVTLPNSVKRIGRHAFGECTGLKSIHIPNGVTDIGVDAFLDCRGLTNATLPNSVKSIGAGAFQNCRELKRVKIPNGLKNVGDNVFFQCSGLQSVTIPNGVTNIGSWAFSDCRRLSSVDIPDSVKSIGLGAFYGCSSLKRVTIPNDVKNLGTYVFYGCRGLISVTIGTGVTNIDCGAFFQCTGLRDVTIPNNVKSIGWTVFTGCTGLTTVTIGTGVTFVGHDAFYGCTRLQTMYVPPAWKGTSILAGEVPGGCRVVYGLPSWTVTFDANGGRCATASKTVARGSAIGTLPGATRVGYVFLGWYTAKSGGSKASVGSMVTSNRTLYARWAKSTYTVAFVGMGGAGRMAPRKMRYGKAEKLPWNQFTRPGYRFLGWSRTKWGAVTHANHATVKNLSSTGGTVKFYARWAAQPYTVAFVGMGGTGTMATQPIPRGTEAKLRWNQFARPGYAFSGWSRMKWGEVAYANHAKVWNLGAPGETVKLYARWKAKPEGREAAAKAKSGVAKTASENGVQVTTSDGSDGGAVADGDETTAWEPDATNGAWVVLSLAEMQDVVEVVVVGDGLSDGMRVLLSEDAEEWFEGEGGAARYVWVAFPAGSGVVTVKEIRVE